MSPSAFARYLIAATQERHIAYLPEHDPAAEFYDGTVRVFDHLGESCSLRHPLPRQLRALATQLQLIAGEIERRGYEDR